MLPTDAELQRMSNEQLRKLWERHPQTAGEMDWIRVAREIRHRRRFGRWTDSK